MKNNYNLLFVCTANICRSPMAEGLSQIIAPAHGLVISARSGGILGLEGKPAAKNSIKVMKEIGMDIGHHRSRGITEQDMEWADHILVMEMRHAAVLYERHPAHHGKLLVLGQFLGLIGIDDPIGKWKPSFRKCRIKIEQCINGFYVQLLDPNSKPSK